MPQGGPSNRMHSAATARNRSAPGLTGTIGGGDHTAERQRTGVRAPQFGVPAPSRLRPHTTHFL